MLEQTLQVARSLWVRKKEFLSTECEKRQRKTIVNNPRARCVNKMINHNYDVRKLRKQTLKAVRELRHNDAME